MRIANVEPLLLGGHFVRIIADTGIIGVGHSACWRYPEAVHASVWTFRAYLIGQDRIPAGRGDLTLDGPITAVARVAAAREAAGNAEDVILDWQPRSQRLPQP